MSWIKLSLIIPMYNVESYISECINSIQNQITDEVEVIIVDDGSTDNSKKILDELIFNLPKNKAKQFKVFSQKNQGQSAARNKALNIACGEYVGFIDSDDIVSETYFNELLNIIKEFQPDLICYVGQQFVDAPDQIINTIGVSDRTGYLKVDDKVKLEIFNNHNWYPWLYVYNREKFNSRRFIADIYFEDAIFISDIVLNAEDIYISPQTLYFYRYNLQGSLHSLNPDNIKKNINSYEYVIKYFYEKIHDNKLYGVSYIKSLMTYMNFIIQRFNILKALIKHNALKDKKNLVDERLITSRGCIRFHRYGLIVILLASLRRNNKK